MQLQRMTGNVCLIYSSAMVLGIDANTLMSEIGHSGTEMISDDTGYKHPHGVHIQEIQDAAIKRGKVFVEIHRWPRLSWRNHHYEYMDVRKADERFWNLLAGRLAILVTDAPPGGHAVAWDGEKIYNPARGIVQLDDDKERWAGAYVLFTIQSTEKKN